MSRWTSSRVVAAGVVVLACLAGSAGRAGEPAGKGADERDAKARASGVRRLVDAPPPVDPRDYPRGVTVVGRPGPVPPPPGGTTLPPGLTPLAPPPDDPQAPRIRIQRETPPAPDAGPPPAPDFDPPGAPFVGPRLPPGQGRDGKVIGPTELEQQVDSFGRPPRPAAGPLPERARWTPREGFPPPPDNPAGYPRPPARWIEPAIDPTWIPTPAWPPDQDLRDWSPSHWIEPAIDPTWEPTDAWGRILGVESFVTPGGAAPGDAARPDEAGTPDDAGTPDTPREEPPTAERSRG